MLDTSGEIEYEHPAVKIGIPVDLYDALAQIADDLEAGRLRHHRFPLDRKGLPDCSAIPAGRWFNMHEWRTSTKDGCGTVFCIAGLVDAKIGNNRIWDAGYLNGQMLLPLLELFFPGTSDDVPYNWNAITAREAAVAIRSLLATGRTDWKKALARKRRAKAA